MDAEYKKGMVDAIKSSAKKSNEEIRKEFEIRLRVLNNYCMMFERKPDSYEIGYLDGLKEMLKLKLYRGKLKEMYRRLKRMYNR